MARFNITKAQKFVPFSAADTRALARACAPAGWRGAEVNIVLAGDAEVINLNRRFTGRQGPTDVLAFSQGDSSAALEPGVRRTIGDVIVNAEHARGEAAARRGDARAELAMYIVHGLLHLAGYNDHSPAQRRRMYAREREVLMAAGWPYVR